MANPVKNIHYRTQRMYLRETTLKPVEIKTYATSIRKVARGENPALHERYLKVTTENGTICTISEKKYSEESWRVLWDYLSKGDPIEIDYRINKIVGVHIPVTQEQYQLGFCFMKDNALRLCFEAEEEGKLIEPVTIAERKNTTTSIWLSEVFYDGLRYIGTLEELEKELDDADDVKVTISSIGDRKVRVNLDY